MTRLPLLLALLASACQRQDLPAEPAAEPAANVAANGAAGARNAAGPTAADRAAPPPTHLAPDAPPLPAESSAIGAARRAQEYCDALATRRFDDAFALWADGGRASGLSRAHFAARFARVRISDCQLYDPGAMQGAAGTVYVEVPAVIRGTRDSGAPLRLEGPIVLKRVNDVPGSTAEQRRWHIARAEMPND